jgi:hypothetical protein
MKNMLLPEYNAQHLARLMKSGVKNKRLPKQDNFSAVIIKMDRSLI